MQIVFFGHVAIAGQRRPLGNWETEKVRSLAHDLNSKSFQLADTVVFQIIPPPVFKTIPELSPGDFPH